MKKIMVRFLWAKVSFSRNTVCGTGIVWITWYFLRWSNKYSCEFDRRVKKCKIGKELENEPRNWFRR